MIELLNSNAQLAELVRDGSVVTEEVSPGRFKLDVRASDTDSSDASPRT